MAFYWKRQLKIRKSDATKNFNLYDLSDLQQGLANFGSDYAYGYSKGQELAIRVDDVTKYVPLSTNSSRGYGVAIQRLTAKQTLYPIEVTPQCKIFYYNTYSDTYYNEAIIRTWTMNITKVQLSSTLNQDIELWASCNSGNTWIGPIAKITKGGFSATISSHSKLTCSSSAVGSEPSYPGSFQFKLRTAITKLDKKISITFSGYSALAVKYPITCKTYCYGEKLKTGKIVMELQRNYIDPLIPFIPLEKTYSSTVMSAGSSSGSAENGEVFIVGTTRLDAVAYYVSEAGSQRLASTNFTAALLSSFSWEESHSVTFQEVTEIPVDIAKVSPSLAVGSSSSNYFSLFSIPSNYW
jgi:hypothetical protein